MQRLSGLSPIIVAGLLVMASCAAGIKGLWTGSGEVGEGHFFQLTLDIRDPDLPRADFQYSDGIRSSLAVCDFKEQDGTVEFRIDPDARADECKAMVLPYKFLGRMGAHVLTGNVLDEKGKTVGMFRAFRKDS